MMDKIIPTGKNPMTTAARNIIPRAPTPYAVPPVRHRFDKASHWLYDFGTRRDEPHQGQRIVLSNRICAHLSRFEQSGQSRPASLVVVTHSLIGPAMFYRVTAAQE